MSTMKTHDFYMVLKIHRSATKEEIKEAYRKMAFILHPDRHDGCSIKAEEFKMASEAYNTLFDTSKRKAYDALLLQQQHDHRTSHTESIRRTTSTATAYPNYRKVYSPQPPPGFKTFDAQRHYDMHYGDGMMKEEIERARKRAEAASSRAANLSGYEQGEYISPLGKGFSFATNHRSSHPMSQRSTTWNHRPPPNKTNSSNPDMEIEYEERHFYDLNHSDFYQAKTIIDVKERVTSRMHARKKHRVRNRGDAERTTTATNTDHRTSTSSDSSACQIM